MFRAHKEGKFLRKGSKFSRTSSQSLTKAKIDSHRIVMLARQSTKRAMINATRNQELLRKSTLISSNDGQNVRKINSHIPSPFTSSKFMSVNQPIIGSFSSKASENIEKTHKESKDNIQHEGGSSDSVSEVTDSEESKFLETNNEAPQATSRTETPVIDENPLRPSSNTLRVQRAESYKYQGGIKVTQVNTEEKAASEDKINSSSLTISQSQDTATLECIKRINRITKDLKAKCTRGKQIANAFIDLIEEVKAQTEKLQEMKVPNSKHFVYNYCYENMHSAFSNYK